MPEHGEAVAAAGGLRPLLKWAGGKRQLLPQLRRYYPAAFDRYVEPFVGSGAVFADCYARGLLTGRVVILSDTNADVIGCYRMVRDHPGEVLAQLADLERGHRDGGAAHFYDVRDRRFNVDRRRMADHPDPSGAYTPRLAAMLIYLNRTGFNGLFRVNARGEFNVPPGRYAAPRVSVPEAVAAWSEALRSPGLTLAVQSFEVTLAACGAGDFVYLDPPYAPLSATARFTAYTAGGFGADRQALLQRAVIRLARDGAQVLLSNSSAPEIRALYGSPGARAAGLRVRTVPARRAINSRPSARGPVPEYLITNVRTARQRRELV
jgi:DNA adenine methylase